MFPMDSRHWSAFFGPPVFLPEGLDVKPCPSNAPVLGLSFKSPFRDLISVTTVAPTCGISEFTEEDRPVLPK